MPFIHTLFCFLFNRPPNFDRWNAIVFLRGIIYRVGAESVGSGEGQPGPCHKLWARVESFSPPGPQCSSPVDGIVVFRAAIYQACSKHSSGHAASIHSLNPHNIKGGSDSRSKCSGAVRVPSPLFADEETETQASLLPLPLHLRDQRCKSSLSEAH